MPILRYEGESVLPGSAGNVARNLAALGAEPVCVGGIGNDEMGRRLRESLADLNANVDGLTLSDAIYTCTKTRIMAGDRHRAKQQICRLDREATGTVPDDVEARLRATVEAALPEVDALIISDYGGGSVSPVMIAHAGEWTAQCRVVVDSRYRLTQYHGVTAATPNEDEFEACVGRAFANGEPLASAGEALRDRLGLDALLVTRGNQGMMLCERDAEPETIPIVGEDDVVDVTGAGDTVVSAFTLALAGGADYVEAAHLANHAAGVVVFKAGTASCDADELRAMITRDHEDEN